MAKYRTYKNGIYGKRYKGFYIAKGDDTFSIMDEHGKPLCEGIKDYDDCEWYIDKKVATPEELVIIEKLKNMEIYQVSDLFSQLLEKKNKTELELTAYEYVKKIRSRKADDKAI